MVKNLFEYDRGYCIFDGVDHAAYIVKVSLNVVINRYTNRYVS